MNLICQFLGHKYNEIAEQNGVAYCDRCNKNDYYHNGPLEGEKVYMFFWSIKHKIRRTIDNLVYKIKLKFKKEDNSVPF